jgi:tetratricopeptide (TPR) repeat protein
MSDQDWFRRSTSPPRDREEFDGHLARSRGQSRKAQYLRLQAHRLHATGDPRLLAPALALLDRLINDFPDHFVLGLAYSLRARVLIDLGEPDVALASYEQAVAARRAFPQVTDDAPVGYVELILALKRIALYRVAQQILDEFPVGLFPIQIFRDAAARALLAEARGETSAAQTWARAALNAADRSESAVHSHRRLGFGGDADPLTLQRLRALTELPA